MTQELLVSIENGIGTIRFNRPEKRNSLTTDMLFEIGTLLDTWSEKNDVRVVVFTGNGETSFSAGFDISAIPTQINQQALAKMAGQNPVEFILEKVASYPYPTIAMINGHVFGAGLNLAVCCDIRVASDTVVAGMPPAKLGLVYHPDGLKQFIDVVGLSKAKELFFAGRTYTGEMILEMGIADHLVSVELLESYVYKLAGEISSNAPLALKGMKTIFSMIAGSCGLNHQEKESAEQLILESFNSNDLKEGRAAFLEKRKPVFKGN